MNHSKWLASLLLVVLVAITACSDSSNNASPANTYPNDDRLRLNHVQIMGTHNSYHPFPASKPLDLL
jgi:hypothetical protein